MIDFCEETYPDEEEISNYWEGIRLEEQMSEETADDFCNISSRDRL